MGRHNTTNIKQIHRSIGVMLGAATGDALGAPFEFKAADTFSETFPTSNAVDGDEMIGGGHFGWHPGEFTDDNQMAMILAEHLANNPTLNKQELWESWKAWARTASDVGSTTSVGLSGTVAGLSASEHYSRNGGRGGDGNGCIMRAHPVAIHTLGQNFTLEEAMNLGREQGLLTHGHPLAGWTAAVYVGMLYLALSGGDPLASLGDVVDIVPQEFRHRISTALSTDHNPAVSDESSWRALGCLANAVWAIRNTETFYDAVVAAINLGEDADTVGCVAGALAGAIYGVQQIPARWTNVLNGSVDLGDGRKVYDFRDLTSLAYSLSGVQERPLNSETHAGPSRVADQLFAASFPSARTADKSFAVVSLCRTAGELSGFARQREFFILDSDDPVDNPWLDAVVAEAVATIERWRSEGLNVLVHCHGGRSRTALILAEWAMRSFGWDGKTAAAWVSEVWPRAMWWNSEFRSRLGFSEVREPAF